MSEELERRWDEDVQSAWRGFRERLADRLAELDDGESLVVELPAATEVGAAPYCQVRAERGWLRVEAVSNEYLDPQFMLTPHQMVVLEEIGFAAPRPAGVGRRETNFWIALGQRNSDQAAWMIVSALHETYGVMHPIYLKAGGLEPQPVEVRAAVTPGGPAEWDGVALQSPDDVRAAVTAALAGLGSECPEWDEDGDLPLPTEKCIVWVSLNNSAPRILIYCLLMDEVPAGRAGLAEVNRLNREHFGLTFVLNHTRIFVTREVGVAVVSLGQLGAELQRFLDGVDGWATELSDRLGPDQEQPRDKRRSRFDTAYAVMVELEREQRGSVGPDTMASIFDRDTAMLLRAVRLTEQRRRDQRRRVRKAREQGRGTAERAAQARQDYMRDLVSRMRAALRLIVDAPVRKVQIDQLALFDEDECGTAR